MRNIIDKMNSLYPISDETIQILKENTVLCHFPKRHQLIEADKFCKSAYFIEEGMTRSFWLVNGEEITTSFACEGAIVFSMDELYYNKNITNRSAPAVSDQYRTGKLGKSDSSKRIQTPAPFAQRPPHPVCKRKI